MSRLMMKCGCVAQGTSSHWGGRDHDPPIPVCCIHDCIDVAEIGPDLAGRVAKCSYGGSCKNRQRKYGDTSYAEGYDEKTGHAWATSSLDLPFFKHCPDKDSDEFFCGCFGWD